MLASVCMLNFVFLICLEAESSNYYQCFLNILNYIVAQQAIVGGTMVIGILSYRRKNEINKWGTKHYSTLLFYDLFFKIYWGLQ